MSAKTQVPGERKTRRAITKLLKTEGPSGSAQLAESLGLTPMAVRQHLYALQREGLVTRLSDPQDARATLVDITARGRARRVELQKSIHDRLIELLDMLPADSRTTLSLAMRVAAPLIDQLTQLASQHPDPAVDRV